MITELTASLTAIKTSLELLGVIRDAKNETEIQKATYELSRQLTDLQLENLRLAQFLSEQNEQINLLKRHVYELDEQKRDFERYTEYKTASGQIVYATRDFLDKEDADMHYACPNCYHQRQISILQPMHSSANDKFHINKCLLCGNKFQMSENDSYVEPPSIAELAKSLNGNGEPWLKY
jgi:hypothetical protein